MKKKCMIAIILLAVIVYVLLPTYKVKSCMKLGMGTYTETTVNVQTYGRLLLNPEEIVQEHIRVNGMPDKLIVRLFIGKWNYRTVVYI